MALSPTSSKGVTSSAVSSVFTRTGAVAAADGDYYGTVAAALTGATGVSRYVGATASGAPVAGTFAVGDLVVDRAGGAWTCTAAGTPGTWSPAVAAGSVSNTHIAPGAAIAASKIQGGTAATSGGLFLLSTTTVAGSAATIDITGISQAYSDLVVVGNVRGANSSANVAFAVQLNGDATTIYDYTNFYGLNATSTSSTLTASGLFRVAAAIPGATATANRFSGFELQIFGYSSTTWHKQMSALWMGNQTDVAGVQFAGLSGGVWGSTAAVNRLTFSCEAGTATLAIGSQIRVYGRP